MARFHIAPNQIKKGMATITGPDRAHILRSLRLGVGDEIALFDDTGREHDAVITEIGPREIVARLMGSRELATESPVAITLCQGLTKGSKMDLIVEKATELGVGRIVPLITKRCDVRTTRRIERWRRIAREAAKQSARASCPEVSDPTNLQQCLSIDKGSTTGILFYEKSREPLGAARVERKEVLIALVGPEGGFSPGEVEAATDAGFLICGLGPRTLRTETAGIVAVALLQHLWGDLP